MELQLPTQTINNNVEEREEDEFYEKIEAPKFVDFTIPDDPFRPDDRYWFCLRVGCDRKHEEELDPEAISTNFVLRVMAARSPNIRLRKALNGRNTSTNMKCPLSAPAKSSKSRLSRLDMVSSMSQKMLDVTGKVRTLPKLSLTSTPMAKSKQISAKYMTTPRNKRCLPNPNSYQSVQNPRPTPMAKSKQISAKYMTTPRNKKCLPNPNFFQSVQNPRPTTVAVPKSRLVAKALVFHSPKKAISLKTSVELRTPLTKICEGMKRLEITSHRKRVLEYSRKSSKVTRCNPHKSLLPLDPSRRQLNSLKDKDMAKDLLHDHNCKDQEAKSIRNVKSKSKQMSENDSSDMETDVNSRGGSALDSSRVIEGNAHEDHPKTTKISGNVDSRDSKEVVILSDLLLSRENSDTLTNATRAEPNSLPNFKERDSEGMGLPRSHALNEKVVESSGIEQEDDTKISSENEGSHKDHQTLLGVGHENEVMDNDDKENAQASDENRNCNHNNHQSERRTLGRQETHEKNKTVVRTLDKNLKDGLTSATTGAPEVKYRKPKPTNPKPFRLRTDERGILREANMERKIHAPRKEAATFSRFPGGNSQRRHGNDIKRIEKCSEQNKCSNAVRECSDKKSEKKVQNVETKWSRTAGLKTSRGQAESKLATRTPQRRFKSFKTEPNSITSLNELSKDNASQKSENSLRKMKSPSLHRQLVSPQGKLVASLITPGPQLSVIKETSSRTSKSKEAGKPHESGVTTVAKATTSAPSRSSSQGRRLLTSKGGTFTAPMYPTKNYTRNTA